MLTAFRAYILIACFVLMIIVTFELFFTAGNAAKLLSNGSRNDTGIFPKRSRNVNAWYLVGTTQTDKTIGAYPPTFPVGGGYKETYPARIGIARTTACPIFRAQDDGSVDPVIIG